MNPAARIRQLASRGLDPDKIAAQLHLRPAVVRRVLGRSAKRGAPRKREASATMSFVTTPDVGDRVRAIASARGVAVSRVIEKIVRAALSRMRGSSASRRRSPPAPPRSTSAIAAGPRALARGGVPSRAKDSESANRQAPIQRNTRLVTAADTPESVRKLLKSYDPESLRWSVAAHRYEIVVGILTRGNDEAKRWLWSVLTRNQVRALVRKYRGAGCAEPARSLLRSELKLSKIDVPTRPYVGFGEVSK